MKTKTDHVMKVKSKHAIKNANHHGKDRRKSASDLGLNGKVSIFELLDAFGAVIKTSDARKRELLAQTIAAYERDRPEQYRWATGTKAPVFLVELMWVTEQACQPAKPSLADAKARGSA